MTITVSERIMDHTPMSQRNPFGKVMVDLPAQGSFDDILRLSDLDFTVEKHRKVATWDDQRNAWIEIPSRSGIIAIDGGVPHGVTTVGTRYTVIQHLDTLHKIDAMVREGLLEYAMAGRDGYGKVFVLYQLPDGVSFLGGDMADPVKRMLLFTNASDGTGAYRWRLWQERLFCTNQMGGVIFGRRTRDGVLSMRHTASALAVHNTIHSLLSERLTVLEEEQKTMDTLYRRTIDRATVERFVTSMFHDPKGLLINGAKNRGDQRALMSLADKRDGLRNVILGSPTMNNLRDPYATTMPAVTLFHGYVEWSDYHYGARSGQDGRGRRILSGTDMARKRVAAQTALTLAA